MKKYIQGFVLVVLVISLIAVSGCATCGGSSYRRDLTRDPRLREAEASYKQALVWLDKAACSHSPYDNEKSYTTAESYLSDAVYKLENLGHDNGIDVSEQIYYCNKIKEDVDVKIGEAHKAMQTP